MDKRWPWFRPEVGSTVGAASCINIIVIIIKTRPCVDGDGDDCGWGTADPQVSSPTYVYRVQTLDVDEEKKE